MHDCSTALPMMTAEQLIRHCAEASAAIFNETGELHPLYHWINADGEHRCVAVPWSNQYEKELAVAFMREMFERDRAVAYVMVAEAWVAMLDVGEAMPQNGVRNHPKSREVVMFAGEDDSGHWQAFQNIIRPESGKAYLGALTIDRPEHLEGNMVGMLPKGRPQ